MVAWLQNNGVYIAVREQSNLGGGGAKRSFPNFQTKIFPNVHKLKKGSSPNSVPEFIIYLKLPPRLLRLWVFNLH